MAATHHRPRRTRRFLFFSGFVFAVEPQRHKISSHFGMDMGVVHAIRGGDLFLDPSEWSIQLDSRFICVHANHADGGRLCRAPA